MFSRKSRLNSAIYAAAAVALVGRDSGCVPQPGAAPQPLDVTFWEPTGFDFAPVTAGVAAPQRMASRNLRQQGLGNENRKQQAILARMRK